MKQQLALSFTAASLLLTQGANAVVDPIWCDYPCTINPSLPPCTGCGVSGEFSYLYWKPYQDNNAWTNTITPKDSLDSSFADIGAFYSNNQIEGTSKDVKYDWDSGFRVFFGVDLPCHYWSLGATWTHFDTDVKGEQNLNQGILVPSFMKNFPFSFPSINADTKYISEGSALWKLRFNQLDFDLKRTYLLGHGITITPYVGLKSLFLQQRYSIEYQMNFSDESDDRGAIYFQNYKQTLGSEFKSFGLKAGLKSNYELFCGLGLFGDFSLASVFGNMTSSTQFTPYVLDEDSQIQPGSSYHLKQDQDCLKTLLDVSFGLEWRTLYDCQDNLFYLRFGWEHHTLFDQNNFMNIDFIFPSGVGATSAIINKGVQGGNLYLYGWTLSLGVHF